MWTKRKTDPKTRLRDYDREMLRSMFVSLFWAAIQERKSRSKYSFQELANTLGVGKSLVSRWFSGSPQNWQIDTIADIADALDIDLMVEARTRSTGAIITPTGYKPVIQRPEKPLAETESNPDRPTLTREAA